MNIESFTDTELVEAWDKCWIQVGLLQPACLEPDDELFDAAISLRDESLNLMAQFNQSNPNMKKSVSEMIRFIPYVRAGVCASPTLDTLMEVLHNMIKDGTVNEWREDKS